MASTSPAVPANGDPLTYINQGQSYELKLRKLGGLTSESRSSMCRAILRVRFYDRRQNFYEEELLKQWRSAHNCDLNIIEPDLPVSYGVHNVTCAADGNALVFDWNPNKPTSIFIKLNCISTEFTAHQHGGEKGVPFLLCMCTFVLADDGTTWERLHSAYAQVRVYRMKGADRKNKVDQDKVDRCVDPHRYKPAYTYTLFTQCFPATEMAEDYCKNILSDAESSSGISCESLVSSCSCPGNSKMPRSISQCGMDKMVNQHTMRQQSNCEPDLNEICGEVPTATSTPNDVARWMMRNRFQAHINQFVNYSGNDLLCLTKEDLIHICGLADGLRLHNALRDKKTAVKLTIYVRNMQESTFHALFLQYLTTKELVGKICEIVCIEPSNLVDIYWKDAAGFDVMLGDEVVQNMQDRSLYCIELFPATPATEGHSSNESYIIRLKSV